MTVYAVQSPVQVKRGKTQPRYDLSPAEQYGDIVEVLDPSVEPFEIGTLIDDMYETLDGFNDDDYIICIGNPILLAVTTAIALNINNGRANLLQWSPEQKEYIPVSVDLGFTEDED